MVWGPFKQFIWKAASSTGYEFRIYKNNRLPNYLLCFIIVKRLVKVKEYHTGGSGFRAWPDLFLQLEFFAFPDILKL